MEISLLVVCKGLHMLQRNFIYTLSIIVFSVFLCSTSYASLITYESYSRDSNDIVVTGGGLEWLMWNQTYGLSASEAVTRYESSGWSIATNAQMANLFNSFRFGETDFLLPNPRPPFVSDENTDQSIGPHGDSQDANNSAAIAFIKLFSGQELDFQAGVEQIHAHAYFGGRVRS